MSCLVDVLSRLFSAMPGGSGRHASIDSDLEKINACIEKLVDEQLVATEEIERIKRDMSVHVRNKNMIMAKHMFQNYKLHEKIAISIQANIDMLSRKALSLQRSQMLRNTNVVISSINKRYYGDSESDRLLDALDDAADEDTALESTEVMSASKVGGVDADEFDAFVKSVGGVEMEDDGLADEIVRGETLVHKFSSVYASMPVLRNVCLVGTLPSVPIVDIGHVMGQRSAGRRRDLVAVA